MAKKYFGIHFLKTVDSGIARINLYNKSNPVADTCTTTSNTTVSALANTSLLRIGMMIVGSDFPEHTKISSIDDGTTVTISKNATGSNSGIAVNFYDYIINNKTVDLYTTATNDPEDFVYWITCDPDTDTYEAFVEHNGTHHASASSPYAIFFQQYLINAPINPASLDYTLYLYHTDHDGYEEQYTLGAIKTINDLRKTTTFTADGSDTEFTLTLDTDRAYMPSRFGVKASADPDITWYEIFDPSLTWGSNGSWDDEIVDNEGHTTVSFDSAPVTGNAYIEFIPKANQYKLKTQINHPNDGAGYVESSATVRILDQAIELI